MAVKFRDYYEVLGIPRTANAKEIKRAYRQLARKHHPDLHPAGERAHATERFKEINEAYEVLSDPEKRAKYDALGENWKEGMDFTPPGGGVWSGGGTQGTQWGDFGDFSDFFASVFGQAGARAGGPRAGRGPGTARVAMAGWDVESELPVTVEELLRGGRRRIALDGGRTLEVEIPQAGRPGAVLRLPGQGGPGRGGGPSGDLYLRLRLVPHPRFKVTGDDLEMDLPLWPWQAVLGAQVRIETPDGPVTLKVAPGTPSGRRLRIRGRGLPRGSEERGDFYAIVQIEVPEHPTAAERDAYEALKRQSTADPGRPAGE